MSEVHHYVLLSNMSLEVEGIHIYKAHYVILSCIQEGNHHCHLYLHLFYRYVLVKENCTFCGNAVKFHIIFHFIRTSYAFMTFSIEEIHIQTEY